MVSAGRYDGPTTASHVFNNVHSVIKSYKTRLKWD